MKGLRTYVYTYDNLRAQMKGLSFVLVLFGMLSVVVLGGAHHEKPRDPRHLQERHPPAEQQYWKERQRRHHQMMHDARREGL